MFILGNIINAFQEIILTVVLSMNLYLFSDSLSKDDKKQVCNIIIFITGLAIMLNILFFYISNIAKLVIWLKNRKKTNRMAN